MNPRRLINCCSRLSLILSCALLISPTAANEIVYRPNNPSFGGDPLNGPNLLNNANAQNRYKDPSATGGSSFNNPQSPLQQFANALQSSILSRVAGAISGQVVDTSGHLIPGTFTIGNLRVEITSGIGILTITTTDLNTGQSTTFQVPN